MATRPERPERTERICRSPETQISNNSPDKQIINTTEKQITKQDIDCLKEAFALFDCDRDGEITVEELGKVSTLIIDFQTPHT